MSWVADGVASEPREKAWATLDAALHRVTFADAATLLRSADAMAAGRENAAARIRPST